MLTPLHYLYLAGVVMILAVMICRKDTPAVYIAFLFLLGAVGLHSVIEGVQVVFSSILYAANQFIKITVTIALVTTLSKCLSDLDSGYLLMTPMVKIMKNPPVTWWILGFTMLLLSLFLWPSSSVALVGAIMLPFAVRTGLKLPTTAMAMNLFGHGIALSYDFIIQGTPVISASPTGITTAQVLSEDRPVFLTMAVTMILAVLSLDRKTLADSDFKVSAAASRKEKPKTIKTSVVLTVCTPLVFLAGIVFMLAFGLKNGDVTSIVSGAAVLLMCSGAIVGFERQSLEKITDYVTGGFLFAIHIFVPVIIIGVFFFLGNSGITEIIGKGYENNIMNNRTVWLVQYAPLNKYMTAMIQVIVGGLTGLDSSGFSGLPLTDALARTFGTAVNASAPALATLGQIVATFVGGGTIVPWGIIPVAVICNINPVELARENLAPVLIGFLCTLLVTCFIL